MSGRLEFGHPIELEIDGGEKEKNGNENENENENSADWGSDGTLQTVGVGDDFGR